MPQMPAEVCRRRRVSEPQVRASDESLLTISGWRQLAKSQREKLRPASSFGAGRWYRFLHGGLCRFTQRQTELKCTLGGLVVEHDIQQRGMHLDVTVVVDESQLSETVHKEADS